MRKPEESHRRESLPHCAGQARTSLLMGQAALPHTGSSAVLPAAASLAQPHSRKRVETALTGRRTTKRSHAASWGASADTPARRHPLIRNLRGGFSPCTTRRDAEPPPRHGPAAADAGDLTPLAAARRRPVHHLTYFAVRAATV